MKNVIQLDDNLYEIDTFLKYVEDEDLLDIHTRSFLLCGREGAVLVDAGGLGTPNQVLQLLDELGIKKSRLRIIVLTHAHCDHVGGVKDIKEVTGCLVAVQKNGAKPLRNLETIFWDFMQAFPYQFPDSDKMRRMYFAIHSKPANPDIQFVGDEFRVDLDDVVLEAKAAPGHSSDSICYYEPNRHWLFTGDSLHGGGLEVDPPCYRDVAIYRDTLFRMKKLELDGLFAAHLPAMNREQTHQFLDLSVEMVEKIDTIVREQLKAAAKPLTLEDVGREIAQKIGKGYMIQALFTAKAHLTELEKQGFAIKYGSENAKFEYVGN